MTYWKSDNFKALQKEWYERLEESGFEDAEVMVGSNMTLRQSATHPYRHCKGELDREMKAAYYNFIAQQIHEEQFEDEVDQLILTWHADGAEVNTICQKLDEAGKRRCRRTVRVTIRRYEMQWGMREYTPRQLNKK